MYFAGFIFQDRQVDQLFDLARVILEPEFARKAHVTLRGPYRARKSISKSILESSPGNVTIGRPGTFFTETQSTVFLNISIPFISELWHKPDYPYGIPHLSFYDGSDRGFAWQILLLLREFPWNITLEASKLIMIDSKQRLETKFILDQQSIDGPLLSVWDKVYSAEKIKTMRTGQRLELLRMICRKVHFLTSTQSLFD